MFVFVSQDVGRVLRGADEGDHPTVLLQQTDHVVLRHHDRGGTHSLTHTHTRLCVT